MASSDEDLMLAADHLENQALDRALDEGIETLRMELEDHDVDGAWQKWDQSAKASCAIIADVIQLATYQTDAAVQSVL